MSSDRNLDVMKLERDILIAERDIRTLEDWSNRNETSRYPEATMLAGFALPILRDHKARLQDKHLVARALQSIEQAKRSKT